MSYRILFSYFWNGVFLNVPFSQICTRAVHSNTTLQASRIILSSKQDTQESAPNVVAPNRAKSTENQQPLAKKPSLMVKMFEEAKALERNVEKAKFMAEAKAKIALAVSKVVKPADREDFFRTRYYKDFHKGNYDLSYYHKAGAPKHGM